MGFQVGFPALRNAPPSGGGGGYDPDVQTWINARAAAGDPVPTAYADAVNQYVLDLKAINGMWATITQLLVFAGATTVAGGLVPIKGLTPTHLDVVDGDFALKTGVKGDGTSKHIDTGYNGTDFSQDDIHTYALITEGGARSRSPFGHGGTSDGCTRINWDQLTVSRNPTSSVDNFRNDALGGYGIARAAADSYSRLLADSVDIVTRDSAAANGGRFFLLARSSDSNVAQNLWEGRILVWAVGPSATLGASATLANYVTPGDTLKTALNAIES